MSTPNSPRVSQRNVQIVLDQFFLGESKVQAENNSQNQLLDPPHHPNPSDNFFVNLHQSKAPGNVGGARTNETNRTNLLAPL